MEKNLQMNHFFNDDYTLKDDYILKDDDSLNGDAEYFGCFDDRNIDDVYEIMGYLKETVVPEIKDELKFILTSLISNVSEMDRNVCGLVADYIPPRIIYEELKMPGRVYEVAVYMDEKNSSFMNSLLLSFSSSWMLFEPTVVCGNFKRLISTGDLFENAREIVDLILTKSGTREKNLKRLEW